MKMFAALATGYLFFSKLYTQANGTEIVLSSCGNQISFANENDVGTFSARSVSTCMTENGALIDMCTGNTVHKFKSSLFKVLPENGGRQQLLTKGVAKTIPAGSHLPGFGESKCGGEFILKRDLTFVPNKDIKLRHLKFTGDGRLINLRDGSTVIRLKEGEDYEIKWDNSESHTQKRNEL